MLACVGRSCPTAAESWDLPTEAQPVMMRPENDHNSHRDAMESQMQSLQEDVSTLCHMESQMRSLQGDFSTLCQKLEAMEGDLQKVESQDDVKLLANSVEILQVSQKKTQQLLQDTLRRVVSLENRPARTIEVLDAETDAKPSTWRLRRNQLAELAPSSAVQALEERLGKLEKAEEHLALAVEAHDRELASLDTQWSNKKGEYAHAQLYDAHTGTSIKNLLESVETTNNQSHKEHKERHDDILEELADFRSWRAGVDARLEEQNCMKIEDAVELPKQNQGRKSSIPEVFQAFGDPFSVNDPVPKTPLEQRDVAVHCKFTLSESTWDAAIWLFTPALGSTGSSLFMSLLLAINVFMQCFLVLTVVLNFTSQEYGEVQIAGLDRWRLRIAHDVFQMSESYPLSIASKVCGQDVSAATSADQFSRADNLSGYFDQGIANGSGLCMAVIVLHWFLIVQEIVQAWDLCRACAHLPKQHITEFSATPDGYEIRSINPSRLGFAVLIATVRSIIAATIMVVGTMWLAHTLEITDLLLNAVALAFIIDIDELLYSALTPLRAKLNLRDVKPLQVVRLGEWRGIDIRSIALVFLMSLGTTAVWVLYVGPSLDSPLEAQKNLCGGNTDFVYGTDPLGMTHVYPTNTLQEVEAELNLNNPVFEGVREAIANVAYDNLQFALLAPNLDFFWHTRSMGRERYADYVSFNLDCEDMLVDGDLGNNQYIYRNYMRYWTSNPDLHSCQNLRQYCMGIDESGGSLHFMTRLLCPTTCGCTNWQNGTMLVGKVYGCPSSCSDKMEKELKAQKDDDCWEPDIKELRENDFFDHWIDEYASVRNGSMQLFNVSGCSALRHEATEYDNGSQSYNVTAISVDENLCHGRGQWLNFKPLAGLCPLSCNCTLVFDDPNRRFCPERCAYRKCKTVNECFHEYKSSKLINEAQPQSMHPDICLVMQDFLNCLDFSERCPPEVQKKDAYWMDKRKTYDVKEDMFYWMGQFGLNCTEILGFEEHPDFHQHVWEGWADSDWKDAWQRRKKGKVETFVPHMGRGANYCATKVLSDSGSAGMADCESRCAADASCEFFSIWAGGENRCVTSRACNLLDQEDQSIVIYKKLPETAEWMMLRHWSLEASTTRNSGWAFHIKSANGKAWQSGWKGSGPFHTRQWIKLVAPSTVVISGFRVKVPENKPGIQAFKNFKFQSSIDGSDWTDVRVGIGERQVCCDWQEFTFPKWAAKYWRLYIEDNHGWKGNGQKQAVNIEQMQVLQEPEKGIWRQYGNDSSICNQQWRVVSSWVDCRLLAEDAGHNYFWFATYAGTKRCGTATSCSVVTSTMLDWRIYEQQACPFGYAQLGNVGDDIPEGVVSGDYNKAASLDDCKSQCDQHEDCGAFKWRGNYLYCVLISRAKAKIEEQCCKLIGTLTCARALCADEPDWVDGNGTVTCNSGLDGGIVANPTWCTDYGKYSEEARQACPVACGLCEVDEVEHKNTTSP